MTGTTNRILPRRPADNAVIEFFASENLELTERIASLEADIAIYRDIATAGIHALHDVTAERDSLRAQLARLRDEYRHLREHLMREAA